MLLHNQRLIKQYCFTCAVNSTQSNCTEVPTQQRLPGLAGKASTALQHVLCVHTLSSHGRDVLGSYALLSVKNTSCLYQRVHFCQQLVPTPIQNVCAFYTPWPLLLPAPLLLYHTTSIVALCRACCLSETTLTPQNCSPLTGVCFHNQSSPVQAALNHTSSHSQYQGRHGSLQLLQHSNSLP